MFRSPSSTGSSRVRAYEEIVGSNLRGDRGEFFTPRNICRMAVAMLDPSEKQLVLDPACGTGGFLITAMNHVIEKIRTAEIAKWRNNLNLAEEAVKGRIRKFAEQFIIGMDFNPDLVKASKMNMVMDNDGAGGQFQANSLEAPPTWDPNLSNVASWVKWTSCSPAHLRCTPWSRPFFGQDT
jgi:type I restriction enzyme M protein